MLLRPPPHPLACSPFHLPSISQLFVFRCLLLPFHATNLRKQVLNHAPLEGPGKPQPHARPVSGTVVDPSRFPGTLRPIDYPAPLPLHVHTATTTTMISIGASLLYMLFSPPRGVGVDINRRSPSARPPYSPGNLASLEILSGYLKRKVHRDSGVSNGSENRGTTPPLAGEIKALPRSASR
ncbi:MAG: hypothetical protein M1826_002323 [Phylliscum demangeonii]|nr:MAG: hypothetical protein M1826_002323 [Phylliscum demangeonii]